VFGLDRSMTGISSSSSLSGGVLLVVSSVMFVIIWTPMVIILFGASFDFENLGLLNYFLSNHKRASCDHSKIL